MDHEEMRKQFNASMEKFHAGVTKDKPGDHVKHKKTFWQRFLAKDKARAPKGDK